MDWFLFLVLAGASAYGFFRLLRSALGIDRAAKPRRDPTQGRVRVQHPDLKDIDALADRAFRAFFPKGKP